MRRIDLHCYPGTDVWRTSQGPYVGALEQYWSKPWVARPEQDVVSDLERFGLEAVLVAFDIEGLTGAPACSSEYVADMRDRHPGVFVGAWGTVDPLKGDDAIADAERAERLGELQSLMDLMRPAVQADGGDLVLVSADVEAGIVEVQLQGACSSCAISSATLQGGVERILMERLPWVTEVTGGVTETADPFESAALGRGAYVPRA